MANRSIYVDKTEIILAVFGKKKVTQMNLSYDQITSISFESFKEFHWCHMVPSEKIVIRCSKSATPIEYTKCKERKYFEEYKEELMNFAKNNRITFYDNRSNLK